MNRIHPNVRKAGLVRVDDFDANARICNLVLGDFREAFRGDENSLRLITVEFILIDLAARVQQNYTSLVVADEVLMDHKFLLALHDKNAFLLSALDQVLDDSGVLCAFATERDVSFQARENVVADDISRAALHYQHSLRVVRIYHVALVSEATHHLVDALLEVSDGLQQVVVVEQGCPCGGLADAVLEQVLIESLVLLSELDRIADQYTVAVLFDTYVRQLVPELLAADVRLALVVELDAGLTI